MATVRMTGLISGLDTESIIKELMSAQRLKNKKTSDKLTLSEWKEDKWKELNAKLYKLYTDDLSKMRLQGSYLAKKVTSSNDSLVTVTGSKDAPVGSHTIAISQLASSQYVTGGKLGKDVTTSTKLVDLGMTSNDGNNTVITIKNGDTEKNLIVTSTTTLGDFINACNSAGINASYDKTQGRLFISSKESGEQNAFSITTGEISSEAVNALNNVKSLINYTGIDSAGQSAVNAAIKTLEGTSEAEMTALYDKLDDDTGEGDADEQKKIDALKTLRDYAVKKAEADVKADSVNQVKESIKTDILNSYPDPETVTADYFKTKIQSDVDAGILPSDTDVDTLAQERFDKSVADYADLKTQIQNEIDAGTLPSDTDVNALAKERYKENSAVYDEVKSQVQAKIKDGKFTLPEGMNIYQYTDSIYGNYIQSDKDSILNKMVNTEYSSDAGYEAQADSIYDSAIEDYKDNVLNGTDGLIKELSLYTENSDISGNTGINNLAKIGLGEIKGEKIDAETSEEMSVTPASDLIITLDGAVFTQDTNTITANGLTINATGTTPDGETININVTDNTEANYDMVKNFINSYNEILKEMNDLYYADSASGYEPLSDDEKEAMTDDQIEKWETKIKDSILRRDSTLGSVIDSVKTAMMSSITIDGKTYSLSTFGIQTSSDYTEKGLLHIYGNEDDSTYSDKDDKLMKALTDDPDATIEALSGIFTNLYDTMTEKMSSIPNVRSVYTFYNDKLMDNEQTDYKKKVADLEDKLTEMEDRYYKQFSAMETALAKLQSQSSALSGLLGTSNQ